MVAVPMERDQIDVYYLWYQSAMQQLEGPKSRSSFNIAIIGETTTRSYSRNLRLWVPYRSMGATMDISAQTFIEMAHPTAESSQSDSEGVSRLTSLCTS